MVTDGADNGENAREETAQPKGWDGNYTTSHANKTINTLQQLERPRKNNRILRTHHHDPQPPRIFSKAGCKSRCNQPSISAKEGGVFGFDEFVRYFLTEVVVWVRISWLALKSVH